MPTYLGFRWREARRRWARAWRYALGRNTFVDDDVMRTELGLGLGKREVAAIRVGLKLLQLYRGEAAALIIDEAAQLRALDAEEIDSLAARIGAMERR